MIGMTDGLIGVMTVQMVAVTTLMISGMTAHLVRGVVVDERLQEGAWTGARPQTHNAVGRRHLSNLWPGGSPCEGLLVPVHRRRY
jgi:hypothetical protein